MSALYTGPIVDAHQHFWDTALNRQPWLEKEARIPFRYGNYDRIKRRYLQDDYRQDAAGQGIVETVYVETEWDARDPIGETRYASGLAAGDEFPNAIVAQAWLHEDNVAEVLAGQAAFPLVRSVRHKPGGATRPEDAARHATLMRDDAWLRGYSLLAKHGLHFDLQVPWWHLDEAVELARSFPSTTIILNHAGMPGTRDTGTLTAWRAALERLAERPNVAVKVSGIGVPGRPWSVEKNNFVICSVIDLFGPDRVMFGSNFPVDSLCARFEEIMDGMRHILAEYPPETQSAFFQGTARRVYRTAAGAR